MRWGCGMCRGRRWWRRRRRTRRMRGRSTAVRDRACIRGLPGHAGQRARRCDHRRLPERPALRGDARGSEGRQARVRRQAARAQPRGVRPDDRGVQGSGCCADVRGEPLLRAEVRAGEGARGRGRAGRGLLRAAARVPLRAARGLVLGRLAFRRRCADGHGLPLDRVLPLGVRQRAHRERLRGGRDVRARAADARRRPLARDDAVSRGATSTRAAASASPRTPGRAPAGSTTGWRSTVRPG